MIRTPALSVCAATLLLLAAVAPAPAQTVTVDITDDVVDFAGAQQVADLPGPDGHVSFREAVTAVNNTAGPQTIEFAIPNTPENEWTSGVAMLYMDFYVFQLTDDETTVDFTTQTDFTGDTNPFGNEVGIRVSTPGAGAPAIYIGADRCVVKGLDRLTFAGYGVQIGGNDNRVVGCTISGAWYAGVYISGGFNGPPAMGNIVGGTEPGEGNFLSAANAGVRIDGPAENNLVIGNTLTGSVSGVDVRSATCCPNNEAIDNRIGGPTAAERNVIRGAGKYGEEGFPVGAQVSVQYASGTIVEGNYIGVDADGVTVPATQRGPAGVELRSAQGSVVRENVIGGIVVVGVNHYQGQRFGNGVHVRGDCTGSLVQGNLIGVDASGSVAVPNRAGITVSYWSVDGSPVDPGVVLVGGDQPGEANEIANSEIHGVQVASNMDRVRISRNSIHDNGALGIDLLGGSGGVAPNDPGDGDTGGNALQNYPELSAAVASGSTVTVQGMLDSTPNRSFTLEFFAGQDCDPSGFGEGEVFLGATTVSTDDTGLAAFNAALAASVSPDAIVTATATSDSTGDTSEFSACVPVSDGLSLAAAPFVRGQTADLTVTNAAAGERVYFAYSLAGSGAGPCPNKLGGLCLDLLAPITVLGDSLADASGTAGYAVPVPPGAPLVDIHLQAVVRRGTGGADSLKSNPVTVSIQP